MKRRLWDLDPKTYALHPLHRVERTWPESNCYIDLWVELLHTAAAEPVAALPVALTVDAEGDQWTFFKFPIADLEALYGVRVFELNIWRSLASHIEEQLALGRPAIVEVDAFYLPDTVGRTYRSDHVKTSIGIQAMDPDERRLGYFHNAGYYELFEDDFTGLLRLEGHLADSEYLPPYVEVAKMGAAARRTGRDLHNVSVSLLRSHLARRPETNPFRRYAHRFTSDLEWLAGEPLSSFHDYAFATLRQCGAAFELSAAYLDWLQAGGEQGLARARDGCAHIATAAKALQFKVARTVNTRKPFDPAPLLEAMATAWDETMATLTARYNV